MAVITIIGGSGFIARTLVPLLARKGYDLRLCCRNPHRVADLKTAGAVGQIVPMAVNLNVPATLEPAIAGADYVINLVGILTEGGGQQFRSIHANGVKEIARLSTHHGVKRLIHLSALGADANSVVPYARSKGLGDQAVLEQEIDSVILRPSVIFGREDKFVNLFAKVMTLSPIMPLFNKGEAKFQPVFVGDVAEAIVKLLTDKKHSGIFELGGPRILSLREILKLIEKHCQRTIGYIPLSPPVSKLIASLIGWAPGAPIDRGRLAMMDHDNVVSGNYSGFSSLGINPSDMDMILPDYCDIYRSGGRFASHYGRKSN